MNKINYTIDLRLKDNNVSTQINKLQGSFTILNNSMKKVNQTFNAVAAGMSGNITKLNGGIQQLNRNFNTVSSGISGNIADLNVDIQGFSRTFQAAAINISENVTEISTGFQGMNQAVGDTADKIKQKMEKFDFQSVVDKAKNFSDAFKALSDSGVEFEQSMADLSAATGITGKDLKELESIARETGKATGIGAVEAANSFSLLADQVKADKVGMEELKILQRETITLAQSSGMSMADAATTMATTINEFGLKASDANKIINVLAAGSKNGSASISELTQSFKVTGSAAASAGLSIEETTGALEVLSQNNLKGTEAGTALQNMLQSMQTTLGMDIGETGFSAAIEALKPKLNDISFLTKTFGADNLETAQFLIANTTAVNDMTTALTGTSVAQEQADIRTCTTGETMRQMQATIDDVKIGFFNLTGGATAYIAAMSDSALIVAQMLPLLNALQSGIMLIATSTGRATIATTAKAAAEKAATAGTWLMTTANTALNAVLNANPIAMITLAIASLVAGIVVAYNNCESFRTTINNVWTGIKQLASGIWDTLVVAFEKVSAVINPVWDKLKSLLGIQDKVAQANTKIATESAKVTQVQEEGTTASINLKNALDSQNNALSTNLSALGAVGQELSKLDVAQKASKNSTNIGVVNTPEFNSLATQAIGSPIKKKEENLSIDTTNLKETGDEVAKISKQIVSFSESIGEANSAIRQFSEKLLSELTRLVNTFTEYDAMLKKDTLATTQPASGSMEEANIIGTVGGALGNSSGEGVIGSSPIKKEEGNLDIDTKKIEKTGSSVEKIKEQVASFSQSIWGANSVIGQFAENSFSGITKLIGVFTEYNAMLKDDTLTTTQTVSGSMMAVAAAMGTVGGALGNSAGEWLSWGANLLGVIAMAVPQLLTLFGVQVAVGVAEQSKLGFPFNILAIGATIAGVAAALIAIPKPKAMANGGIVYGNTFAQVGEYPGAINNPEVIAPLSKLKTLIQPSSGMNGEVMFKISGNALVGILNKTNNKNNRIR